MVEEAVSTLAAGGETGEASADAGTQVTETPEVQAESTETQNWRDSISAELTVDHKGENIPLRDHPSLSKYNTPEDAYKALVEAQKLIGKKEVAVDGIKVPGEDATDEERAEFTAKMREINGVPEKAEDYDLDITRTEGWPVDEDGNSLIPIDENMMEGFTGIAHEIGLSKEQAAKLLDWYGPVNVAQLNDFQKSAKEAQKNELDKLRHEHGDKTPKIIDAARSAALAIGGEALLNDLGAAGNKASVMEAFAKIAPLVTESGLKSDMHEGTALTKAELQAMQRDPRYADPMQRDPAFVKKVKDGFARLYPGGQESNPHSRERA